MLWNFLVIGVVAISSSPWEFFLIFPINSYLIWAPYDVHKVAGRTMYLLSASFHYGNGYIWQAILT